MIVVIFTMSKNPKTEIRDPNTPSSSRSLVPAFRSPPCGGGERIRTVDLLLAKQALSHLSYTPNWWAWEDLNFRPHAYQARALTS